MGYSPMAGAYCVMKKLNYILKPAQKAATVKHVQQQTVRHIIFQKNSAKICRIAKNERFTSVSPQ